MWRSLSAFVCVALAGCASVPGIPLERVGEVNAALENIPAPPQGHEFVNYSIDSTGVKARIAPAGTTAGVIQSRGSYYGGYGGAYGYAGGYSGYGGYQNPYANFQAVTPIGPYQERRCVLTGLGPICNTVHLPVPPGSLPGF